MPYLTWTTAAATIQDAVDVAQPGDTVLATNGIYVSGGRAVTGSMTNRVVVTNPIVLRSVNGPNFTFIVGAAGATGSNGDGAVRCIYLNSNAVLNGFTLTNGHTLELGNDYDEKSGGGAWCHYAGVVISNCVFIGNSAALRGGGAFRGTYYNSTFIRNSAQQSGGTEWARHYNSVFLENSGGGAGGSGGEYYGCRFYRNRGSVGGGISGGIAVGCVINNNHAYYGGGAAGTFLNNCTVTHNSAVWEGGGVLNVLARNSIIYYNTAKRQPNHAAGTVNGLYYEARLRNVCTTPLPTLGESNFSDEPQLASASHLGAGSPCIGRGSRTNLQGRDIDGQDWAPNPSVGADEFSASGLTGPLTVGIDATFTNVATLAEIPFGADVLGAASASVWDFNDGTIVSNRLVATHAWSDPGVYQVRLTAFNETHPAGVSATVSVHVVAQPEYYVAKAGSSPAFPYTSRATAATNIQDAIAAGTVAGRLVLVDDGVYDNSRVQVGYSAKTNRIGLTNLVIVRSVNGPAHCAIAGEGPLSIYSIRCAYVGDYSVLSGFTLTNGYAYTGGEETEDGRSGAGAWCEPHGQITNCVLQGNVAYSKGGGAYQGKLVNCLLVGNTGQGAAYQSTVVNCVLSNNLGGGVFESLALNSLISSNVAIQGGAAYGSILSNCVVVRNHAFYEGGGLYEGTALRCELIGNSAGDIWGGGEGGAAHSAKLIECNVRSNYAIVAGGATWRGTNRDSTFIGNTTAGLGGAMYGGWSSNCLILANSATNSGGGTYGGLYQKCAIIGNWARTNGGGTSSGILSDCILSSNVVNGFGGGAAFAMLTNCVLSGNVAGNGGGGASTSVLVRCHALQNTAGIGGGTAGGTIFWSILDGNTATTNGGGVCGSTVFASLIASNSASNGGGAYQATLIHGTVVGNAALTSGGGVFGSFITNSIVVLNSGPAGPNFAGSTFNTSCTTPHPGGRSNIVNDPLFVNPSTGNFQLRYNSPCVDAITNVFAGVTNDLNGNARPLDGRGTGLARLDMGAYEYNPQTADSNEDTIPDFWVRRYGLDANDSNVAAANPDQDPYSTLEEWIADTNPTNATSFFRIESLTRTSPHLISFPSSSHRIYTLLFRNNAGAGPWMQVPGQTSIPGSGTSLTLRGTNGATPIFYRVEATLP